MVAYPERNAQQNGPQVDVCKNETRTPGFKHLPERRDKSGETGTLMIDKCHCGNEDPDVDNESITSTTIECLSCGRFVNGFSTAEAEIMWNAAMGALSERL